MEPLPGDAYFTRALPRNDSAVRPAVAYQARVPTRGVTLAPSSLLGVAFYRNRECASPPGTHRADVRDGTE